MFFPGNTQTFGHSLARLQSLPANEETRKFQKQLVVQNEKGLFCVSNCKELIHVCSE